MSGYAPSPRILHAYRIDAVIDKRILLRNLSIYRDTTPNQAEISLYYFCVSFCGNHSRVSISGYARVPKILYVYRIHAVIDKRIVLRNLSTYQFARQLAG